MFAMRTVLRYACFKQECQEIMIVYSVTALLYLLHKARRYCTCNVDVQLQRAVILTSSCTCIQKQGYSTITPVVHSLTQ